ncbi:MAG: phage tail tape measure protein [Desulfobulbus sp.]|nr:phage tail tape measure protein [Desulfobulbus sp.]
MAENMRAYLELMGKSDGLRSELNSSKSAVSRFTSAARSEFASLRGTMGSLTGQLAALGVSFSALKTLSASAGLDKDLTRTRRFARATAGEMANLRKELWGMSRTTGRPLEELQAGFDNLLEKGLDWKQAMESIRAGNIGATARTAEIATMNEAFAAGAQAFNIDLAQPGKAVEMLDKMAVAADKGQSPLQDLAAIFSQFGRAAATAGLSFDKTLGFIEGLSQAEQAPERLAALTGRVTRVFSSRRYMKYAQQATGVRFFDKKTGERRDATDVLADLKKKYDSKANDKQRTAFLQKAFGRADEDSEFALKKLFEGDGISKMTEISKQLGSAGGTINRDLGEAGSTLSGTIAKIQVKLREAADDFSQPINDTLNNLLKWTQDGKDKGGLGLDGKDMLGWGAGGIAGVAALTRYGGKAVSKLLSGATGLAAGVGQGKALQAMAGVTPVFVVNMPGSGFGDLPGAPSAGTSVPAPAAGKVGVMGRLGQAGQLVGSFAGGYAIGTGINQVLGHVAGESTDGKYGGEGWLGNLIYDLIHPEEQEIKNEVVMNISIDKDGRVTSSTNDANTQTQINVDRRGRFGSYGATAED